MLCSRVLGINRCKTQETKGGGGEAKSESNAVNKFEAKMDMDKAMTDGHLETFPTLYLETFPVSFENQRETEETEGGGKKIKLRLMNTRKRATRCTTTDQTRRALM